MNTRNTIMVDHTRYMDTAEEIYQSVLTNVPVNSGDTFASTMIKIKLLIEEHDLHGKNDQAYLTDIIGPFTESVDMVADSYDYNYGFDCFYVMSDEQIAAFNTLSSILSVDKQDCVEIIDDLFGFIKLKKDQINEMTTVSEEYVVKGSDSTGIGFIKAFNRNIGEVIEYLVKKVKAGEESWGEIEDLIKVLTEAPKTIA